MTTGVAGQADGNVAHGDVVTIGEALIDLFAPSMTSLNAATHLIVAPGGAPANVAAGVAKLGGRSAFVGVVGADPFGTRLRDALAVAGVDVSSVRSATRAPTTLALVAKPEANRSEFVFYRDGGADTQLSAEDVATAAVDRFRIIHIGGVSLSAEPSGSAVLAAATTARSAGRLVSYDPNWRPSLWADHAAARSRLMEAVALADIVKLSDADLEFLVGPGPASQGAERLLDGGPDLVVVTSGSRGAHLATEKASLHAPGFVIEAVDSTGCGDAFMAGLLVALLASGRRLEDLDDADLAEVGRFANAAGALTATRLGGIPALPARGAVEALLVA